MLAGRDGVNESRNEETPVVKTAQVSSGNSAPSQLGFTWMGIALQKRSLKLKKCLLFHLVSIKKGEEKKKKVS